MRPVVVEQVDGDAELVGDVEPVSADLFEGGVLGRVDQELRSERIGLAFGGERVAGVAVVGVPSSWAIVQRRSSGVSDRSK